MASGRHRTTDGTFARRYPIGDASDYRVHHFRWADGLLERLEGRFTRMVERYPDRVYPAANLAFCAQYRRTGRIDLEDPVLETRPAPRLQYPSPNRAAEILVSMAPNPYAIDDFDSAALFGLAREVCPRRVLEFGPGRSTLVWAFLGCEVDTLEYDAAEYRWVSELLAPLANVRVHPHGKPIDTPLPYARYDLAFVDGPSGRNYAGHTRLDAVLFAVARANTVLLHDSNRDGERETLDRMTGLGYDVRSLTADGRGIAVITKRQGARELIT